MQANEEKHDQFRQYDSLNSICNMIQKLIDRKSMNLRNICLFESLLKQLIRLTSNETFNIIEEQSQKLANNPEYSSNPEKLSSFWKTLNWQSVNINIDSELLNSDTVYQLINVISKQYCENEIDQSENPKTKWIIDYLIVLNFK